MKIVTFLLTTLASLAFSSQTVELSQKYQTSKKCQACHMHIIKDWRNSWHAKSHYNKDEYFRASIDYLARKSRKSVDVINVECAKCHNPRIKVTKVSDDYNVVASIGLNKGSKVQQALQDKTISEGINCLVCHNVDKIHTNAPASVRGIDRIEWTKNGLMSGPFADAHSPYHKTQQKPWYKKDPNKLCFVCHANDHSYMNHNLQFTNMEKEYKGNQKCTSCHMGKEIESYASSYRMHGKVKKRKIRHHTFDGAHKESLWKGALDLQLQQKGNTLLVEIYNPQPHNIPTGFGGREILVEIQQFSGTKLVKKSTISLTTHYTRKRGKKSTPHVALKASKDMSIPAKGTKKIKIKKEENINNVKVTLYYRLVNDEIHNLLDLKDPIWEKKFFITSKEIKLK